MVVLPQSVTVDVGMNSDSFLFVQSLLDKHLQCVEGKPGYLNPLSLIKTSLSSTYQLLVQIN